MKWHVAALAFVAACWPSGAALAVPVVFNVSAAQTAATMAVLLPFPGAPQAVVITGSIAAEVDYATDASLGLAVTRLEPTGGALAFSDTNFVLNAPAGISLALSVVGAGATLSGPPVQGFAVGADTTLLDLVAQVLALDVGTLSATGSTFGTPLDVTADLGVTPLAFTFPLNSIARIVAQDLGGNLVALTLTIPLDLEATFYPDDIETSIALSGQLVLTGPMTIPEPSTGLLVCLGLVLLGARSARR